MTTVRAIRRDEIADYNKLSTICFTYTMKEEHLPDQDMPEERLREIRGMFDEDGTLLGGMVQLEMDCRFEGHDCRFLGIGGVVTDPAERRRGAIRQIFEESLPRLRDAGFVFSALYPFSHVFYRKFGYEWGILQRNAEFKPECLRKDLCRAATIRRVLPGEDDGGMSVYEAYIRNKNLAVIRREDHWKPLREGTPWGNLKHAYVLMDEHGAPMAYWVGVMERGAEGTTLTIKDMAYTSRSGCEAIFSMFRTMNEVGTIRMMVPQDLELRWLLNDPYDMKETTSCGGMVRVMDAERALALLPAPPLPGHCTVEVTDEQIPANNGRFTVNSDGHTVSVTRADTDLCDLTCTINGLSALVVGLMDFEEAIDSGMGEVLREENRRFMAMLFCKRKTHLHNYF